MTVVLDSTSSGAQGFFNRFGAGLKLLDVINEFLGSGVFVGALATDMPKETNDLGLLFDGVTNNKISATVDGLLNQLRTSQNSLGSYKNTLRTAMQNLLIEMVDSDNPLPARTVNAALEELIAQMTGVATVDANEPTASISGSTTGNGNWVVSLLNGSGKTLENAYDEDITIKCTAVATNAGTFSAKGESAESDKLSWNWPKGSGATKTYTSSDAPGLLTNGTFETFTVANTPDNWTIAVGLAGTDVLSEATTVYKGSKALEILGDGSTLTQLYQTLTGLSGITPYMVNFWCRVSTNPAAGVLTVDLHDGTSVINDAAGTANSFTVDLTTLGTTFVSKSGTFRLPAAVPSTVRLRFRLSTAITNTHSLFIDHAALVAPAALYAGGPYLHGFSGATGWAINDTKVCAVANDYRGQLQTGAFRMYANTSLLLPSATGAAETISDGLVT